MSKFHKFSLASLCLAILGIIFTISLSKIIRFNRGFGHLGDTLTFIRNIFGELIVPSFYIILPIFSFLCIFLSIWSFKREETSIIGKVMAFVGLITGMILFLVLIYYSQLYGILVFAIFFFVLLLYIIFKLNTISKYTIIGTLYLLIFILIPLILSFFKISILRYIPLDIINILLAPIVLFFCGIKILKIKEYELYNLNKILAILFLVIGGLFALIFLYFIIGFLTFRMG